MKAKITGFAKSNLNEDYKTVFCSHVIKDEFTGLDKTVKGAYLCLTSFHFVNLIGKQCEITLVHSDKLNRDVAVAIKEVK